MLDKCQMWQLMMIMYITSGDMATCAEKTIT